MTAATIARAAAAILASLLAVGCGNDGEGGDGAAGSAGGGAVGGEGTDVPMVGGSGGALVGDGGASSGGTSPAVGAAGSEAGGVGGAGGVAMPGGNSGLGGEGGMPASGGSGGGRPFEPGCDNSRAGTPCAAGASCQWAEGTCTTGYCDCMDGSWVCYTQTSCQCPPTLATECGASCEYDAQTCLCRTGGGPNFTSCTCTAGSWDCG